MVHHQYSNLTSLNTVKKVFKPEIWSCDSRWPLLAPRSMSSGVLGGALPRAGGSRVPGSTGGGREPADPPPAQSIPGTD